jgi:hypothetical protein
VRHDRISAEEAQENRRNIADLEKAGPPSPILSDFDQKRHGAVEPAILLAILGLLIYFAGISATIIIIGALVGLLALLILPSMEW